MLKEPTYYEILELSPTATQTEITAGYRKLAARYHPDKHQGNDLADLAQEKFTTINEAFETLSDPAKRGLYDRKRQYGNGHNSQQSDASTVYSSYPLEHRASKLIRLFLRIGAGFAVILLTLRMLRHPLAIGAVVIIGASIWLGPKLLKYLKKR